MTSRALVLGAVLFLSGACARPARPPDILIVTLDAVRADRVPGFGGADDVAPHLGDWIATGRRFTNAYTSAPLTVPAHLSLFTGDYAHHHGARAQPSRQVVTPRWLEEARRHGYLTAAFVAVPLLRPEHSGLRGFSLVDAPDGDERPAAEVIRAATAWIAEHRAAQPVFVWVHLFDAHFPYLPRSPRWRTCPESAREAALARVRAMAAAGRLGRAAVSEPHGAACLDDLYASELGELDQEFPALRRAFPGAFVWAIVSDHGECLGEGDGRAQHGGTLAECALRIPLAVGGISGAAPGSSDTRLASLVDVAPTLAQALGWSIGPVDGVDLLAAPPAERTIRFETPGIAVRGLHLPLLGGRANDEKVVLAPSVGRVEAWRWVDGRPAPLEPESLSSAGQHLRRDLEGTTSPPAGHPEEAPGVSEELLRRLGYVE